jgi:tRNA pseudouridine55 synthase
MNDLICVWKPVGITPLEAVKILKNKNIKYKNEVISYAGRLDPMAEGVLLLLIGEENKNRSKYLSLDKEYETEIILGISTDSFDGLGLITNINFRKVDKKDIKKKINIFIGKQNQIYPSYSSKTVNGIPLYWWARKNKLNEIIIPSHDVEIYSIKLIIIKNISVSELTDKIINKINKVKGNFRQKEIINNWIKFKQENKEIMLTKIKIKVSCSSGTYIRVLANDLGKNLGVSAFAFSIKRLKVDKFNETNCIFLDK